MPPTPQSKLNIFSKTGKPPEIYFQHLLFLRISSRDNKKTKTGWSNHRNGGFHRDKCKVYQQREDTRVNADTLRQSENVQKSLFCQDQVVK